METTNNEATVKINPTAGAKNMHELGQVWDIFVKQHEEAKKKKY